MSQNVRKERIVTKVKCLDVKLKMIRKKKNTLSVSSMSLAVEISVNSGSWSQVSIIAWRIPWTEPGGLCSTGLQRVGHY